MMNKADSEAGNKAVDSLINYETVKVCGCYRVCFPHHCFDRSCDDIASDCFSSVQFCYCENIF